MSENKIRIDSQSPNFDAYLTERLTDPEVRAGFEAAESEPQNLVRHPDGSTSVAQPLRGAWWVRLELWLRAKKRSALDAEARP